MLDRLLDPWQQQGAGKEYDPSPLFPRVLELSDRATKEVYDQCATADDPESRFVLIGMEDGMLRSEGHLYKMWENATKVAMHENLVIFSARSRRAVRIVWYEDQLPMRTTKNFTLELVKLKASPTILDSLQNKERLRRLFYVEE